MPAVRRLSTTRTDPSAPEPGRLCAIHQPHYLPWPRYFDKIAKADVFVILDDVQYSKNGWQNRNRVKGPQGPFILTVPVRHRLATSLLEVEVADDRWRRPHLEAIRTCYGRSPGFPSLRAALETHLRDPWQSLVELNCALIARLLDLLAITTPCVRSSSLAVAGTATTRLAEICHAVGATHYLSGAHAAAAYLEPSVLRAHGIDTRYHLWEPPTYPQAHPAAGFVPDLSIVDLLAATGEEAGVRLRAAGTVVGTVPEGL